MSKTRSALSFSSPTPTVEPLIINPNDSTSDLCKQLDLKYYDVDSLNPFNKATKRFNSSNPVTKRAEEDKRKKQGKKEELMKLQQPIVQLKVSKTVDASKCDILSAQELRDLVADEFAARYLEQLGITPTQQNVENIMKRFPLERCHVERRRGDAGTFLQITPNLIPEQAPKANTRRTAATFDIFDESLLSQVKQKKPQTNEEYEDLFPMYATTPNEEKRGEKAREERQKKLPPFDEYCKRYVYPYNLASKFRSTNDIEEDILSNIIGDKTLLGSRSSMTIYEFMHKEREADSNYFRVTDSRTAKRRSERSLSSQSASSGESRSTSPYQPDVGRVSRTSLQDDIALLHVSNRDLRSRFSGAFSQSSSSVDVKAGGITAISNALSAAHKLYDLELSKPPFLANSEINELQAKFIADFPFKIWKQDHLSTKQREQLRSSICSLKLTKFIRNFSIFCYWTFLGEFSIQSESANHDMEQSDEEFLQVYADIIELMKNHRKSKRSLIVDLPITLLCIRVVTETVFKICYMNWWQTQYSEILAQRMDKLVSFLFDPDDYLSHLAPIESNVLERKMANRVNREHNLIQNNKLLIRHRTSKLYSMSPVIKLVLHDADSFGARSLIKHQVTMDKEMKEHPAVEQEIASRSSVTSPSPTLNDISRALRPKMRSQLLDIYMRKFSQLN